MIKDSTLVQVFLNQFYRRRLDQLEQFVSPNFSYTSPAVKPIGFVDFVTHCEELFECVTVYVNGVKNPNDQCFVINYSINVKHDALKDGYISMPSYAKFMLVDNLIENIKILYDPRKLKPKVKPQKTIHYL
ncbi:MAG: hypothetical protein COB24_03575 [Hyphomicrobiales bacterium]|nr:MAG: hypothetical protein COB24_03575 [Hyphomicrobiales bacterium]